MKDQVELLKESCDMKDSACVRYQNRISELEKENKKLKNSIAYWKRKADENQEKADDSSDPDGNRVREYRYGYTDQTQAGRAGQGDQIQRGIPDF